jgi:hypothetical protein
MLYISSYNIEIHGSYTQRENKDHPVNNPDHPVNNLVTVER